MLDGEVKLEYGDELIHLDKGDSVYIYAAIPHVLAPAGRGTATVLSVSYDPRPTGSPRRVTPHCGARAAAMPHANAAAPR